MKPEKWAHMKRGNKRAVKFYDNEAQATAAAAQADKGFVEYRKGENTRCLCFCPSPRFARNSGT